MTLFYSTKLALKGRDQIGPDSIQLFFMHDICKGPYFACSYIPCCTAERTPRRDAYTTLDGTIC